MRKRFWNQFLEPAVSSSLTRIPQPHRWPATSLPGLRTRVSTIWMHRSRPSRPPIRQCHLLRSWRPFTLPVQLRSYPRCVHCLEREPDASGASNCYAEHGNVYRGRRFDRVAAVGSTLRVEVVMGYILADGEPVPAGTTDKVTASVATTLVQSSTPAAEIGTQTVRQLRATPVAKRIAAEHGIDLRRVTGSGPGGRIVEADVAALVSRCVPAGQE